jgi:hypothetical protein
MLLIAVASVLNAQYPSFAAAAKIIEAILNAENNVGLFAGCLQLADQVSP